ncbi:DUF6207 family protein [Streptomyces sp. NPDC002698]|uniref:DUF6207 family protein n=1 Tax=Streptomyces sp. NPDC002698 TaxID=3364660 RepID=UPI00368869C0
MDPIDETHVSRPGLVAVDVAAADDDTAPTFRQPLAADRWATVTAEWTTRDAGQPGDPPPEARRLSKGLPSAPGRYVSGGGRCRYTAEVAADRLTWLAVQSGVSAESAGSASSPRADRSMP